ncbi:hypothetical protein TBLA_0E00910 [Henningerozyma blattae CBS 6284]|uniref:ribonuclease Z n=1 Tax=Henningerozyma blattae (strain ATCC 34711 / CBS 6284 / DSM 70876 / NBRC 10599 / NRRL Y-10934 / UCD 77-7) TaxID=1071380 RepID=I2H450_HENB6|nr:hypothetical protein TBLA_0E00910 [Tetrapisispora blattae CBS 6284]CCH61152.1 hypothetical protein TBLA_0E00910 [Tetrapisispora blattae CBS 6284]
MFSITPVVVPSSDTRNPLLLLQTNHGEKYLIGNIPEGTQRSFIESKVKLSKLKNIFLTGTLQWDRIGGLPGLLLTAADQGRNDITFHSGNQLLDFMIASWRYFVYRPKVNLKYNILSDNEIYHDKHLTVRAFVISPYNSSGYKSSVPDKEIMDDVISKMFPENPIQKRFTPGFDPYLNISLPCMEDQRNSTSYEICFNPIRGRFQLKKALELGIPKGPLFARLSKGETVKLEDGSEIKPQQVLDEDRKFCKILILDLLDDNFVNNAFLRFREYDTSDLGAVYYFLTENVHINSSLIEFMELFGSNVDHFVSHPRLCPDHLVFKGSTITTLKLKSLQVHNYNLPRINDDLAKEFYECFNKNLDNSFVKFNNSPLNSSLSSVIPGNKVHILEVNNSIQLDACSANTSPKVTCLKSHLDHFDWETTYNKHVVPLNISASSFENTVKSELNINHFNEKPNKDVEVVTLGTGSALPSKYRNVLSSLLKIPYTQSDSKIIDRYIMLDAGENTIGTMRRLFDEQQLSVIFKNLKLLYLSHQHADHHLGIISILTNWYKYNKSDPNKKIYLVIPWQYNKFIEECLPLEGRELLSRVVYINCEDLLYNFSSDVLSKKYTKANNDGDYDHPNKRRLVERDHVKSGISYSRIYDMFKELDIVEFQTCRAIHCNWAYSNSITFHMDEFHKQTFKISYSGDTRPNVEEFSKHIGLDSDLLIHEASLENNLLKDAIKKQHCTINEAIKVSNEMNAKKLILTHFSQRYPKVPSLDNNIEVLASEFCFAFDGLIVKYDRLGDQQKYFSMLNKIFIEEQTMEDIEKSLDSKDILSDIAMKGNKQAKKGKKKIASDRINDL